MYFYLRVINPGISLLVFLLCTWAAILGDHNEISFSGIVAGTFPTYFFAKGLFTSTSLWLIGKILLEMLKKSDCQTKLSTRERFYSIAFICFTIGALTGLYFWGVSTSKPKETSRTVTNPTGIVVSDTYRIKEASNLKMSITIKNSSTTSWIGGKLYTDLIINGKYSGNQITSLSDFKPNDEKPFILDFNDFQNVKVPDSISFKFKIEMDSVINK